MSVVLYQMESSSQMNPHLLPGGAPDTLTHNDDRKACKALGIPNNAPLIVNFHTYNTSCKGLVLTPMIDAIWKHEGLGTNTPPTFATANGHEARKRITAVLPEVDVHSMAERQVHTSSENLATVVRDSVLVLDLLITLGGDGTHVKVKDNFLVGGSCGKAWTYNSLTTPQNMRKYIEREIRSDTNWTGNCM